MHTAALRRAYSRAETVSDAVVHVVGLVLAVGAIPVLIVLSAMGSAGPGVIVGIALYSLCLLAMLGFSAVYNITYGSAWSHVWMRFDHSAIYLKIAGTFTGLVALTGGAGGVYLASLWGVALGGTSMTILAPHRTRLISIALYLGLGWVGVAMGWGVMAALAPASQGLIVAAGCLYTLGVGVFLWWRLPYHIAIWHVVVLVASGLIYGAVMIETLRVAG